MAWPTTPCGGPRSPELCGTLDEVMTREWLLTDGLGGFASGSVIGCPTRRYHGLLVASKRPPLERYLLWSGTLDTVIVGQERMSLSAYDFGDVLHPAGHELLTGFNLNQATPDPWVEFTYEHELFEASKRITMCTGRRAVRLSYEIRSRNHKGVILEVQPLLAMRDFHGIRKEEADPWDLHNEPDGVWVHPHEDQWVTLALFATKGAVTWQADPVWWQKFRYRVEDERGFDVREDLQLAGTFRAGGSGTLKCELAGVGFVGSVEAAREYLAEQPAEPTGEVDQALAADPVASSLAVAGGQFVVRRESGGEHDRQATIIAGYPWFGDWGRDSFISLEGLLLIPGRYDEAREVLSTFAGAQRNGLIPNRFDDYGGQCAYNSVDASLWFIHAADAYLRYTEDKTSWGDFLEDACRNIIDAFSEGTDFNIRVDDRGTVCCGDPQTQITWMDAKCDDVVFTPRNGRPVEVNALWYHGLHLVAERAVKTDPSLAKKCQALIRKLHASFTETFWNESADCLYDCVRDDGPDAAIRPNQIFAVSLAHSPLSPQHRRAIVGVVTDELLTPYGLRTLAPDDYRYISRYEGGPFERDRAYHNGTVWPWLIGPYVEAHLRVQGFSTNAKQYGRRVLQPLIDHMSEAGLGTVSEIFDAEAPYHACGCPAQAWSVAELLRAWLLTDPATPKSGVRGENHGRTTNGNGANTEQWRPGVALPY